MCTLGESHKVKLVCLCKSDLGQVTSIFVILVSNLTILAPESATRVQFDTGFGHPSGK